MKQNQKGLRKWNVENQWKLITQVQFKYCIQIDYFKLKIRKINENRHSVCDCRLPFYMIFWFSLGLLWWPWFRTCFCDATRMRLGHIDARISIRLHGKLHHPCCDLGNIIVSWFSTVFKPWCWKQFEWSLCQNMVSTIQSHWMTLKCWYNDSNIPVLYVIFYFEHMTWVLWKRFLWSST